MSAKADTELSGRILTQLGAQQGRALGIRKLLELLSLPPHANRQVRRLLKAMVGEGRVVSEGRGRYCLSGERQEIEGVLGRPRRGWIPLESPKDGSVLLRIGHDERGGAMPGDSLVAQVTRRRGSGPHDGRVIGIEARGSRPIVGVFRRQAKAEYLVPDDERVSDPVLVTDHGGLRARDGQVVAVVVDDPRPHARPRGRIVRVLGEPGEFGTEVERLLLDHGLEREFPEVVEAELAGPPVDRAAEGRADLRMVPHVTIDPPDARDFDDAVFVERLGEGYRLWVSIADVAVFVPEGSAVDTEAARRGCSTYLPRTVFPMLPHALSEGTCSLAPGLDRAAVTLELELDSDGVLTGGRARRGLIRSAGRLTYAEVQDVLDGRAPSSRVERHADAIRLMGECAGRLLDRMEQRGQLTFDLPEAEIELDRDGWPATVRPAPYGLSNRVVEAFMVAANEAVAGLLTAAGAPLLYRVHPPPEAGKIEEFTKIAASLGAQAAFGPRPAPRQVAEYLRSLRGRPAGPALELLLLRSLMQARYTVEQGAHFGLASPCYLHFTSPIRRYPDLAVHRQLGGMLTQAGPEGVALGRAPGRIDEWPIDSERATLLADSCNRAERRALAAERDAIGLYQAAYMSGRIGEEFDGRVTFVADFGLFVRLEPSGVEGLVHIARMRDDFYQYDKERLALSGRRTGKSFRVGERIRVRVESVNLSRRQVDLAIAGAA